MFGGILPWNGLYYSITCITPDVRQFARDLQKKVKDVVICSMCSSWLMCFKCSRIGSISSLAMYSKPFP